ncbi:unnamed protein product [Scytosiphon promiscuus]
MTVGMTDFSKWDKFDADAAEKEVERKAKLEEEKRAAIMEERASIKLCQDRAARLKSEAVVRALKAKRGSRRRPTTSTNSHSSVSNASSAGKPGDDAASVAKASADEAEAIVEGLRRGLELRDEAVADAETGDWHRGVHRARDCLAELEKAEKILRKAAGLESCGDGDDGAPAHGGSRGERGEEGARVEMAEVLGVVRRAKTVCRVAEGACLVRGGRVAESTETLRKSLFENPTSVASWVARGEAFLAMKAPLLAGLHFDRALELDRGCGSAASFKESLRRLLSADAEATSTKAASAAAVAGDGGADVVEHVTPCKPPPSPPEADGNASLSVEERGEGDRRHSREAAAETGGGAAHGESAAAAFRRAAAAACESYRAGVVLHQEAFFSSSRDKFLRTLELLEEAEAVAGGAAVARGRAEEEKPVGRGESGEMLAGEGGGGDGLLPQSGVTGLAGAEGKGALVQGGARAVAGGVAAGAEVMRDMRVGCHLNIAAAFLLRKTEFSSAADHCSRALDLQPGNTRALVRRAQAHQELGHFRLAVEDLEAAEASLLSRGIQKVLPGGQGAEAHTEELEEVVKRLEHARWTKVVVGNNKDELPRA